MDTDNDVISLLSKYDKPIPRYTSYPTVPYWQPDTINPVLWEDAVMKTWHQEDGQLSIYIHLPYCESLCTFCACNKRITKNHQVEDRYINAVLKEWNMYKRLMSSFPIIKEIHLGGGTPTFFSPKNLSRLIASITNECVVPDDHEYSIEIHPNYTKKEHLEVLRDAGFTRISVGVQDFDPHVQYKINRVQTYQKTKEVVDWARELGYTNVNIDLVYGLPGQTVENVEHTIARVNQLMPDRIAFYSYAHVPWKSKGQRRYTEADLPAADNKWKMYQRGRELLEKTGLQPIGMDHFALVTDKLYKASLVGKMHRNFMGYTTTQSKLLIGLGASAISDSWNAFVQNEKEVEAYEEKIERDEWPIITGHKLNEEDLLLRKNILQLMCENKTVIARENFDEAFYNEIVNKLRSLETDKLITLNRDTIYVTPLGKTFIRNICSSLDSRMWRGQQAQGIFSRAI